MSNLRAFGDSVTAGTGASSAAKSYVGVLNTLSGLTTNNKGVSSRMALDVTTDLYNVSPAPAAGDTSILEFGINDEAVYATDTTKLGYFIDAMAAAAIFCSSQVTLATPANGVTFSADWNNSGYALGMYGSDTTGGTAQFSFSGDQLAIGTLCQYPNGGGLTVHIDGVLVDTISNGAANIGTILGQAYGLRSRRYRGLGAGSHTCVVTQTGGGGSAGNTSYLHWFSTMPAKAKTIVVGIPHGYGSYGFVGALANGSNANVDSRNVDLLALVTELQGYGLDVSLLNTNGIFIPCLGVNMNDNIHPNDYGHSLIANGIFEIMGGAPVTFTSTPAAYGNDGNLYIEDATGHFRRVLTA